MDRLMPRIVTNRTIEVLQNDPETSGFDPGQGAVVRVLSFVTIASASLTILIAGFTWLKIKHVDEINWKPKMILVLSTLAMVFLIARLTNYEMSG